MILLGLCGPIGSGKSTLALRARKEMNVRMLAFGDELKRRTAELWPLIPRSEFGWTGTDWVGPKSTRGRGLLKAEGELARKRDKSCWIPPVEALLGPRTIIHDVRHLAEIEWIMEKGGEILVLEGDAATDNHPSEMEWRAWAFDYGGAPYTREIIWTLTKEIFSEPEND